MILARTLAELRDLCAALRHESGALALVPTMGALHDGHLSLVRETQSRADNVVASIGVFSLFAFACGIDDLVAFRAERAGRQQRHALVCN